MEMLIMGISRHSAVLGKMAAGLSEAEYGALALVPAYVLQNRELTAFAWQSARVGRSCRRVELHWKLAYTELWRG